jgi:hypothetical protein
MLFQKIGLKFALVNLTLAAISISSTVGAAYKTPSHHVEIEFLARTIGYEGGTLQTGEGTTTRAKQYLSIKGDARFRKKLNDRGYKLKDSIDDRDGGMQAVVLEDAKGKNFIIFRGTELQLGDAVADLDRQGDIGNKQFEKHKDTLKHWSQKYPGSTITGHSLGSALGQRFVAEHPDSVREGVFFNPPGIDKRRAHKYADSKVRPPVTHYVAKGKNSISDLVSEWGGQSHISGRVVEAEIWDDTVYSHSSWMLGKGGVALTELDYQKYQDRRVKSYWDLRDEITKNVEKIDKYVGYINFYLDNELMTGPSTPTDKMVAAAVDGSTVISEEEELVVLRMPRSGSISVLREDYFGVVLDTTEPVINGDILAFQMAIEHLGGKDNPISESLTWQLFGPGDRPIDKVSKTFKGPTEGEVEPVNCRENPKGIGCFRFKLRDLANGTYHVKLFHQNVVSPNKIAVSIARFNVNQTISIKKLVVDSSPVADQHRPELRPDDVPHFFVYYDVIDKSQPISATLQVVDRATGTLITNSTTDKMPKPDRAQQRAGIRLDPGIIGVGQDAEFKAELTAADGQMVSQAVGFTVSAYTLGLHMPDTLITASGQRFDLLPPSSFKAPYNIDIRIGSGLVIYHTPGELDGTVTGVTESIPLQSRILVNLIDATGRKAVASRRVLIQPLAATALPPPPPSGAGAYTAVDTSDPNKWADGSNIKTDNDRIWDALAAINTPPPQKDPPKAVPPKPKKDPTSKVDTQGGGKSSASRCSKSSVDITRIRVETGNCNKNGITFTQVDAAFSDTRTSTYNTPIRFQGQQYYMPSDSPHIGTNAAKYCEIRKIHKTKYCAPR